MKYQDTVERWDVFEVTLQGRQEGNPFVDYTISGTFTSTGENVTVDGFYDGDGIWKVRFMPSFEGRYHFSVEGSFAEDIFQGDFTVTPAGANNHGPVRVARTFYMAYEDGTPYYSRGTTCYVWNLQEKKLQEQTLATLAESGFNKLRFCVWPKHYVYNFHEPISYPYEGTPMDSSVLTEENFDSYTGKGEGNAFDYTRFNPAHFQHLDRCVERLRDMGIEADLIVMHPYDRWGFSQMSARCDDLYWRYLIARLGAYRNIWWSLANEYDLFPTKTVADWERMAALICAKDPYRHLRSIHNCRYFYDYSRPWITHCSIQRVDLYKTAENVNEWRQRYQKPVILDEIAYEGNIQLGWGNISGQEMTRRFWEAFVRGGYPGHGETYLSDDNILWWSHGGELKGESPARIRFMKEIMEDVPAPGLRPIEDDKYWDCVAGTADTWPYPSDYYIFYFSFMRPSFRDFDLDDDTPFHVEVIDTWNMTIRDAGIHKGKFRIPLPGREYIAVRVKKAE